MKDLVISAATLNKKTQEDDDFEVFPDFFAAAQKDFAARMDWTVKSDFSMANHAPIITLDMPRVIKVKAGQELKLHAKVKEPDGDGYTSKWWHFNTLKSMPKLMLSDNSGLTTTVKFHHWFNPGKLIFW